MADDSGPVRELARAKVNLFLHILGRRADGYHRLESLAVFPDLGDLLTVEPAQGLSLSLGGPFGGALDAGPGNLVLRAALALRDWARRGGLSAPGAAMHLDKRLPVASGIGGGSADAAAALRALSRLWRLAPSAAEMAALALALGADAPVCLRSRPAMMSGIGERLGPAPAAPGFWVVLVNPRVPLPTSEVFAALIRRDNPPAAPTPARFADFAALAGWLRATRNDLEAPACALRPQIGEALDAIRGAKGCALARMSGSGATCFGLYATQSAALAAADAVRGGQPAWWIAAAGVAGPCAPVG